MNDQPGKTLPQFYVTAANPCPYLPDRSERKVFTHLLGENARPTHDALTASGFRRSQHIAYKPACEGCQACVSVRIPVPEFEASRNQKRLLKTNADVTRTPRAARASFEQFMLLRLYLDQRHPEGGMSEMAAHDYAAMAEETPVATTILEYRDATGRLIACALTDVLSDGISMVYSFYDPSEERRSLGTYMILDHVSYAKKRGLSFLYLGYWVSGCRKMDYKRRFQPLEALGADGWARLPNERD